jgi:hypothetical protein
LSDENITISVDDAAIDEAIAKLDEALEKTGRLTGQTPEATQLEETKQLTKQTPEEAQFYTIPNSEMDAINAKAAEAQANVDSVVSEGEAKIAGLEAETASAQTGGEVDTSDATAKLDDLEAHVAEAEANVDDTVATGTAKLTDLEAETEQAKTNVASVYTIPNSEMEQVLSEEEIKRQIDGIDSVYLRALEVAGDVENVKANVDDVVSESEQKLDTLKGEVDATQTETDDVVASEGGEIKGLDSASSRVIRMIPGLREAQRIQRSLGALSAGSVMGVVGLLMVAYQIYKQVAAYLEEQKQLQIEYRQAIMEARNFTTIAQVKAWQADQDRIMRGYVTRPPI